MFSEGADTKAFKGLLDPCGGFYIVVLDRIYTTRKTETKAPKIPLPAP